MAPGPVYFVRRTAAPGRRQSSRAGQSSGAGHNSRAGERGAPLPGNFLGSKEAYSDRPKSLSKNGINQYVKKFQKADISVTGKKIYATSQQIFETVKSLWTKSNKKESLPQPKEKTKLGSSAEIQVSGKTTHVLKQHSVPLPTELSSEAKTKSVSTSGATQFMPDPKLMDHGQSHPEDIDMYSTRS
ncbi:MICOS complex subunit MIC27-like [Sapajus apella]|uniref:MICOS complex subunit MIC27-like n=1 Tax=Sapajus apella TaxID=9515 RepID=A0A6J3HC93_SAPAP|nr:MICOS complex subunit MIC27-like [Sapajus apella]